MTSHMNVYMAPISTICLAPDNYITMYNLNKAEIIISGYASTMKYARTMLVLQ